MFPILPASFNKSMFFQYLPCACPDREYWGPPPASSESNPTEEREVSRICRAIVSWNREQVRVKREILETNCLFNGLTIFKKSHKNYSETCWWDWNVLYALSRIIAEKLKCFYVDEWRKCSSPPQLSWEQAEEFDGQFLDAWKVGNQLCRHNTLAFIFISLLSTSSAGGSLEVPWSPPSPALTPYRGCPSWRIMAKDRGGWENKNPLTRQERRRV